MEKKRLRKLKKIQKRRRKPMRKLKRKENTVKRMTN